MSVDSALHLSSNCEGNSRKPAQEQELDARFCGFDELLGEVDFVCVVVPLTERTHKLIGRRELALMKPSAVLVNEQEPLRESPLFALSNVVTLPHAGSATHETRRAMAELALDNLEKALLGGTPRYRVNPQVRGA